MLALRPSAPPQLDPSTLASQVLEEYDDEVAQAEAAERAAPAESDAELRPFVGRADAADGDGEGGGGGAPAEGVSDWTLRKSCAQTLDHLSHEFPDRLLGFVLPVVDRYMHVRPGVPVSTRARDAAACAALHRRGRVA